MTSGDSARISRQCPRLRDRESKFTESGPRPPALLSSSRAPAPYSCRLRRARGVLRAIISISIETQPPGPTACHTTGHRLRINTRARARTDARRNVWAGHFQREPRDRAARSLARSLASRRRH